MLLGFETNEIKKIWEKKSNLDQLRGNIDCAIGNLNSLLLKLLPYNRSINANEDIVIKVDINKHSVVIMDVRKRKSYCLNDFDLSGNDDFLDIITSIIDWNKIIKNINSILDEELVLKHDNYNFICNLIDSLRKQEISNEEDGKDYADAI